MDNFEFKIPDIASGKVVPPSVAIKHMEEEKEDDNHKRQFRHEWFIAIFSSLTGLITGAISGVLASIIYNEIISK